MSVVGGLPALFPVHHREQKTKGHKSRHISHYIDQKKKISDLIFVCQITAQLMEELKVILVCCIDLISSIFLAEKQKVYKQDHITNKTHGQHVTDQSLQSHHSYQ